MTSLIRTLSCAGVMVGGALFAAVPVRGHHEAIFGPQSAAVLSPDSFLSVQVFSRRSGPPSERTQETTTVLGGGFSPTGGRLSFSLVVPFSFMAPPGSAPVQRGLEDAIIGARYRVDLGGLKQALGARESYVLGIGGIELPTGTMDHEFGQGSAGSIAAGLMSVEVGSFSVVGYGYFHRDGVVEGFRGGGSRFFGASGAWTPIDNMETGRVLSFQLGASHETTTRERLNGVPLDDTGGRAIVVHPTVTWGLNKQLLVFALTSIPVSQRWSNASDEQQFRVGLGTIFKFGGS
jgi:hypothetical protein